jgi:predicted HAD superfamily phosphohydrolase
MLKLAVLLPILACAGVTDSTVRARFAEDSTLAVSLLQSAAKADSTAQVQRIQARTIWDLAVRNLQRDTAKAK